MAHLPEAGVRGAGEDGLSALPAVLAACGYGELAASFRPWADTTVERATVAVSLDDPLRGAAELLMLGRAVPLDRLPAALVELLPALERAGVAVTSDGAVQLHGLALYWLHGVWLFAHVPQSSPTLYFGQDSAALAARLETRPGRALDLCAGPGVQSLVCAARGMEVVAVEVNPVAAALCSVNVTLNGLAERVAVRCGDLYAEAQGERFELVCANPPLLPIPDGLAYPFVGDGGPDGLAVTRRVLDGLDDHLTNTGHAQLLGMTLSDGFLPLGVEALRRWCETSGLDLTWTTVNHLATTVEGPWARGVGATSAAHEGRLAPHEIDAATLALAEGYAALGASHVCTYFLRASRARGGRGGRLRYVDVSDPAGGADLWFR